MQEKRYSVTQIPNRVPVGCFQPQPSTKIWDMVRVVRVGGYKD